MEPTKSMQALKQMGLDMLSVEEQEDVLLTMSDLIFKEVLLRSIESLSDEGREEFERVLETADSETNDVAEWMTKNVPNIQDHISQAIDQLSDDILAATA